MIPVPYPSTVWDGFWLFFRVTTTFAFIGVTTWGLVVVRQMLLQIQSDRLERDSLLADLKLTAEEMAKKTSILAEKLIENTELTRVGVDAAKEAYHQANQANDKIAQTNIQLARAVTIRDAETSKRAQSTLDDISRNTFTTADNTKKDQQS